MTLQVVLLSFPLTDKEIEAQRSEVAHPQV